jgi:hypothetical protein
MDAMDLVRDIPYDISVILREFRKGRVKIEFEHLGLKPIRLTMERVANKILLILLIRPC